jgi:hypothetical protein
MQTKYKSRGDLKSNPLYNEGANNNNSMYDVSAKWIGKDKDGNNLYIGATIDPKLQSDNHKFTESLRLMLNELEQKSTLKKDEEKKYLDKNWDNGYENRILTGNRFENGYTYFELFTRDEKTLEKKQLAVMSGNLYPKNQEGKAEFVILNMHVPKDVRNNNYSVLLINETVKVLNENKINTITALHGKSLLSANNNETKHSDNIANKAGLVEGYRSYSKKTESGSKNTYTESIYSQKNIEQLEKNLESKGFNFTLEKANTKTYEPDTSHVKAFNTKQNEKYGLAK